MDGKARTAWRLQWKWTAFFVWKWMVRKTIGDKTVWIPNFGTYTCLWLLRIGTSVLKWRLIVLFIQRVRPFLHQLCWLAYKLGCFRLFGEDLIGVNLFSEFWNKKVLLIAKSVHNVEFSVITNIPGIYHCWSNNFLSDIFFLEIKMKMSKLLVGLFSVGFSNRIFFQPGYGYQQPLIYQQPGYQQPIIGTGNYYAWSDRNIDDNCDRTQVKSNIFSLFF